MVPTISQISDLYGSGLAREDQQPVARRMAAEIDQDIDAIVPDPPSCVVIGDADEAAPTRRSRRAAAPLRHRIVRPVA